MLQDKWRKMANNIKRMEIKEFREKGYLQELNRRFLHPLGLALGVMINDDNTECLGRVWDFREDDEDICFDIANSDAERKDRFVKKKLFIDTELSNRTETRRKKLGFDIEPLDYEDKD